ncbi:TetR/AcrR family transcriptional regulator C-terminal domain-containing protein [Nonomuraea sp. NPDC050310]|uniref:TetR/AcrR family transcriptional regulator n=1 Tax=unclassified Nonomuraea TaxID=2593643 RepID=UPI00340606E6
MATDKQPVPSLSVWTRPRGKREQPALSQDRIVAEAIKLLDEAGIDALSMRSLGTRLGAGATSLYRHVTNKDELIELVVDEIYGEMRVPAPGELGWREALAESARSLRAVILRHPWVASVLGQVGLVQLGPNLMRQSKAMLDVLRGAGFPETEYHQAVSTLTAYVIGIATSEAAYLSLLARSGMSEEALARAIHSAAAQASLEAQELHGSIREGLDDPRRLREEQFTYGLERLLDGLESRLA